MPTQILESVKKVLGLDPDYKAFDTDITMHINTVFDILRQLGVGPEGGFALELEEEEPSTWEEYFATGPTVNAVKTYVYLRVRLYFDPPATSFAVGAMEKQVQELEWRLNVQREEAKYPWTPPPRNSSSTME